ncbi:hypothetical protein [Actinomycetospora termitidis]|uniref:DUF4142 domain-containing protein n=1 Tax=Actinomycetospora termitidis TaxID=3053470 RepID=A0ABT7M937_9PSEU|nr:hypothetical protein [Actinomycetospora sp. Odt1-22]MDL5156971.1 hypothetical protein [Actinomycetospora sp. Odt1-22]
MASQAARIAGRGAFTAAAVMAVAGGTASMAFAHEAPSPQSMGHEVAHQVTEGAHKVSDASKKVSTEKISADSVKGHGEKLQHHAKDVSESLKKSAPSAESLPELPVADMVKDLGHAGDNAKNDIAHAQHNWTAAVKDGLTADEAREQVGLMGDDVQHAVSNGKADVQHWAAKAAPAGLPSVLSFS